MTDDKTATSSDATRQPTPWEQARMNRRRFFGDPRVAGAFLGATATSFFGGATNVRKALAEDVRVNGYLPPEPTMDDLHRIASEEVEKEALRHRWTPRQVMD